MVDSKHIDSSAKLEDLEAGHHITVVTVKDLYLFMGRELETLDCMPAGNVLGTYNKASLVCLIAWSMALFELNMEYIRLIRPPDKNTFNQKLIFLFLTKHMLWELKRTVSMRGFF